MKNRYTTLDVVAAVHDLKQYIGMRVNNVYDVNSKTYLIKLQKPEKKAVILFESGLHILSTGHDWEKSQFPSSFSMKLRKHIKNRRLECVDQVGVDRVVDLGFGDELSRVHVIVELYDRGNILLTDQDYTILNILRPRTDKDTDVKFAVRNRYPVENARKETTLPSDDQLTEAVVAAAMNFQARRLLSPLVPFGGALIEHALVANGYPKEINMNNLGVTVEERVRKLRSVITECSKVYERIHESSCHGFITFKSEQSPSGDIVESFIDYHPYQFAQCAEETTKKFESFSEAVDEFLSKMTTQKADQRALNIEREALKKLENVKKDQEGRVEELDKSQEKLKRIAELIIQNEADVDQARKIILSALAHQLSWDRIGDMCRDAARQGDRVASKIVQLKLDTNHIVMKLTEVYHDYEDEEGENEPVEVPIDLALNAFQNSKKLFDAKKAAGKKKEKTIQSSIKALKSAEAKAKATLETVRVRKDLAKTRKPMWFEKFLWFVSRDGLICVAGRDAQQNELLVKKYLRTDDVYVHADVRGAASVVIRNVPGGGEIPPKTLTEAAQMAVCYSNAWDAKVVASAWWVNKSQVSRTAPSGEYLTPGSFMIRGKKNFMPASQLIMGLGILFKLDEESVERRREEKKRKEEERGGEAEKEEKEEKVVEEVEEEEGEEVEVDDSDGDDENGDDKKDEEEEFPDVQVPLTSLSLGTKGEEEFSIINVGPAQRSGLTQRELAAKREREKAEKEKIEREKKEKEREAKQSKPRTKREKHKMEKIKQKYGDQDEEERELRMMALGSRGKKEEPKEEPKKEEVKVERAPRPPREPREEEKEKKIEEEDDDDEKEENSEEANLLETLTGYPTPEDTLLYAVVVVAPYQVLNDYKYKVKLIPGTGKRGKAAKSAIELFMRSKKGSPREESLLKSLVGDEAAARNIPGKVKVSAPNLHAK